jgi:Putative Actinobacterial Holin-X, holin superfamily III
MTSTNVRPFPEIFSDLIQQLSLLVRKETQLARAEVSEKAGRALSGIGMMMVGAILLIPAMVILLQAAMAALVENGMSASQASLIVGGAAFILGMILALVGWSWVKPASLVPDKTIDQLQQDAAVARHAASTTTTSYAKPVGRETGHGYDRDRAA